MHDYQFYGLSFTSKFEIPNSVYKSGNASIPIHIEYHQEPLTGITPQESKIAPSRIPNEWKLTGTLGESYILDLNGVIYVPPNIESHSSLLLRIPTFVIPQFLALRGDFIFHASAIAINSSAYIILGESGVGKSTLAAYSLINGAFHLADDLCRVEKVGDKILAYPTGTYLYLDNATEKLINLQPKDILDRIGEAKNPKYFLRLNGVGISTACACHFPLKKMLILSHSEKKAASSEELFFESFMMAIPSRKHLASDEQLQNYLSLFGLLLTKSKFAAIDHLSNGTGPQFCKKRSLYEFYRELVDYSTGSECKN